MDNFCHCTVILYLNHKESTLKDVKEEMMFTAEEDTPSYKVWWKGRLLSWNVARRLWNLSGASNHFYSGDYCKGSCSIIIKRRVQSFILSWGVSPLGPKAPWIWSEMDSEQLVRREWQLKLPLSICDHRWNLGPSLPIRDESALERFSALQES